MGWGLVWNSILQRNKVSFTPYNFISIYTALSDNTGGHLQVNTVVRTCTVIKVVIQKNVYVSSYLMV